MSRKREKPYFSRHAPYNFPKRRRPHPADPPIDDDHHFPDKPSSSALTNTAVVIIGLSSDCSVLDLKSRFEIYGPISRTRMDSDGVAYITFRSRDSAESAISASIDPSFGITLNSTRVQVMWASDPVPQWREGVKKGSSSASSSSSKLLKPELPLSRHGRGNNKLNGSAIVNVRDESSNNNNGRKDLKDEDGEEKQELWSWGAGTEGQLGTGKLEDEHVPQFLPLLPSLSLLSCGGAHVIALTHGQKVLTWGRGTSGQLGHGNLVNGLEPKSVEVLNNFNITHVSAGWNHSGFVSECGHLFTCGDGSFGQLGLGDYVSQSSPMKVSYFASRHVCEVACGMRHSLALLKGDYGNQVYGFGSGKRGQLGISKEKIKSVSLPQSVSGLQEVNVCTISANGDHSAALSSDGHLYTWGRGFDGTPDVCCPNRVISHFSFKQAALGWNHALVLTDEGDVLMLGGSHHGALSNPQKGIPVNKDLSEEPQVKKIPGLSTIKVVGVASGSEHSVLTTENGVIMAWGWGEHGQLGLGDTCDQTCPQVVNIARNAAHEYTTSRVYCGSGFTFVLRAWSPR